MNSADELRPARWSPLYPSEEQLLLDLAMQPGAVGATALSVIARIPLRAHANKRIEAYLERRPFESESEPLDKNLSTLDARPRTTANHFDTFREPRFREWLDPQWIYSTAPGFSRFTDEERSRARRESAQQLSALASKVEKQWLSDRRTMDLHPITVTLLFELAARDGSYYVPLGNGIASVVANNSADFQPDIVGLFAEYSHAARSWCSIVGKEMGPWYLDGRDDESGPCWRGWQLAWVISRGGLAGVVEALSPRLHSGDASEQITALALLSDVADYVVQEKPEHFGGGRPPPRVHPDDPARRPTDAPVRLGVSAPIWVQPRTSFVARLVAYTSGEEERAMKLLRGSRGRARPALDRGRCRWPLGTRVSVTLSGDHLEIRDANREFVWNGEATEAVFDVQVSKQVSEVVLRFDIRANDVPAGNLRLEVDVEAQAASRTEPEARGARINVRQSCAALSAFASYASADRERVLDGVNTMKAIKMDVFTDCLDLHPGEDWKKRLAAELRKRDLFVLFWSSAARKSKWVSWELNTVFRLRGKEPICVNPLEPDVEPPPGLKGLHFSSAGAWVAAAIRSTKRTSTDPGSAGRR